MKQESLADIINRRLNQRGLARATKAAQVCLAADQIGAGRFRATSFHRNTLTVVAVNAIVASELRFEIPSLMLALRQKLGLRDETALSIRIRHQS